MRHPFASFFSTSPTRKMGIAFDATTGLDPVLTGGSTVTWTSTAGTVATGTTPSPALDEATLWTIEMDDYSAVTAIDANTDNVTKFIPVIDNTGLATITLNDNPNLDVDALVSVIHALRRQLPAMTVNIGGTCPGVTLTSFLQITDLEDNYSHTWTQNNAFKLLDAFPASAAYSVARKLRTDFSGSAIRVRRASDNSEQDIGFDSNGDLDTSSLGRFAFDRSVASCLCALSVRYAGRLF